VRANDDAKVPVARYHIYRRHFAFFRMSRHAFLEIKPEVTAEGLEKLLGTSFTSSRVVVVVERRAAVSYLLVEKRRRDTQKFRNYL
jgi:hypothetical protein